MEEIDLAILNNVVALTAVASEGSFAGKSAPRP